MFWWIVKIFNPHAVWGNVVFSFGDTIYYNHQSQLTTDILAHEKVHLKQQHYSKIFAIYDTIRCIIDKKYYLRGEIEAYQAQNRVNPNPRAYASHLSSPVYNNIISYEEALELFI